MTFYDWIIIAIYISFMIGLSFFLGRNQKSKDDYFVGGRNLPWWAIGISTMATQTSAIGFISVPAFVALKPEGGMAFLQYELAVPLAMIFIMIFFIPFFRSLKLISVYEYLELRFGRSVRLFVSGVFLVSRGLGTGVGVYATGIVLTVCLGTPLWTNILLIGAITLIYDTIGGMKAVVYSDVIQMIVLLLGVGLTIFYAVDYVGGVGEVIDTFPDYKWTAFQGSTGLGDGGEFPFWAFLFGGFFLYASYYGVDQTQAQRELSARTERETNYSLTFNGIARFLLTLLYIAMGVSLYAVYVKSFSLQAAIPHQRLDFLVPQFIIQNLPVGVRGIIFSAILAAAMSSLDSSLNSLSAATMQDFVGEIKDERKSFITCKITTVVWGILITLFAFFVGNISNTVVESINKIGSAFYGPILAAFFTGVLFKRSNAVGIFAGVFAGVITNVILWLFFDQIFWIWWNLFGFVVSVVVTLLVSSFFSSVDSPYVLSKGFLRKSFKEYGKLHLILLIYFVVILSVILGCSA